MGKNTWTNQNPEFKNDWLLTFVIHPGDQYTSYPFPEVIHICFLKGDLALINDWLVQLDHDYTEDIRELLVILVKQDLTLKAQKTKPN